ncbi:MAG: hypothetical protein IPM29_25645 [Planctomycetes bacterium]|nr:hypothetical protein [Planctomycetota bacterium]
MCRPKSGPFDRPRALVALVAAGLAIVTSARAQSPRLLLDLNTYPPDEMSSDPLMLAGFGGFVYFEADFPPVGRELFRTDGTANGTSLVCEIEPGFGGASYWDLTPFGGLFVFGALDNAHGSDPWISDGTPAGTRRIIELVPGNANRPPGDFVTLGSRVVFRATTPQFGEELWTTDGTAAGTRLLADVNPGSAYASPAELTVLGHELLFVADDGVHGREPWLTDGTAAGTRLLADLAPGNPGSNPFVVASLGSRILLAPSGTAAVLWVTDGTPAGTTPIATPLTRVRNRPAHRVGGGVVLIGDEPQSGQEMWYCDGTAAGTYLLGETVPGAGTGFEQLYPLDSTNGARVLVALAGAPASLWVTDGTVAGTRRVATLAVIEPADSVDLGSIVVFRAHDATLGEEPWRSDGTPAGTYALGDLNPGSGDSDPATFTRLGARAVFGARSSPHGREPWITDGTVAGTREIVNVGFHPPGWSRSSIVQLGGIDWLGRAVFCADIGAGTGPQPIVSDGTAAGTGVLHNFVAPGALSQLNEFDNPRLHEVAGDLLLVVGRPSSGPVELWLDRGSGPVRTGALTLGAPMYPLPGWATVADAVWLGSDHLWQVRQGVPIQAQLGTGPYLEVAPVVAVGQRLFARATDSSGVTSVWGCDGPSSCTRLPTATGGRVTQLLGARRRAFFVDDSDPVHGAEVWVTDGTAAGTRVLDLLAGPTGSAPRLLLAVGDHVLFQSRDPQGRFALWLTDGTLRNTHHLDAFPPGTVTERILYMTPFGLDHAAFVMNEPSLGWELWVLTPRGARLVADLAPGTASSYPTILGAAGDQLWFRIDAPSPGLWRTDGTTAGTVEVLPSFNTPPAPYLFACAAGQVFVDHDDVVHGNEPWVVSTGATAQSIGTGCGVGTRVPLLEASDPVLGGQWLLRGGEGPLGSTGVVMLGAPAGDPAGFGSGCTNYVEPVGAALLAFIAQADRDWAIRSPLPTATVLVGAQLAAQLYCWPSTNALGVEFSNALWLSVDTW